MSETKMVLLVSNSVHKKVKASADRYVKTRQYFAHEIDRRSYQELVVIQFQSDDNRPIGVDPKGDSRSPPSPVAENRLRDQSLCDERGNTSFNGTFAYVDRS